MSEEQTATAASADCTPMRGNYAIEGNLAIGVRDCLSSPRLYVNGNAEVTDRAIVRRLTFGAHPTPALTTDGEAAGQLGLTGILRVTGALGIGTDANDDLEATAHLVLQGEVGSTHPLQQWQHSKMAPLGAIDARGRLGLFTTAPTANLSVTGAFLIRLSGMVSGKANIPTITGDGDTKFPAELRAGDLIQIPDLPGTNIFRVLTV